MKSILNPQELAQKACHDFQTCYGSQLISVILYGSAAGSEFHEKTSDINLLLVLDHYTLAPLEKSIDLQEKWMKSRFARPLFMDKEYINSSIDTFPIEFLNMQNCYQVLFGEDVLKDLKIEPKNILHQAERELKGKRLHLMQGWCEANNNSKKIQQLVGLSLRDFTPCFKALLGLQPGPVPQKRLNILQSIEKTYQLKNSPLSQIAEAYIQEDSKKLSHYFPAYSDAIYQLTKAIDLQHQQEKNS